MRRKQLVDVDESLLPPEVREKLDDDTQCRVEVASCRSTMQALMELKKNRADYVLVLSPDNKPVGNVIEYVQNHPFDQRPLTILFFLLIRVEPISFEQPIFYEM